MKLFLTYLFILFLPISISSQSYKDVISTEEKIYGLSKVWSEINYNFAFMDRITFDVDSLYKEMIPRVLEARNNEEYINVLREFLGKFDNNKTLVLGTQWMYDETDTPALMLDESVECCIVKRVESKLLDRIPPKSKIIKVDGKEPHFNLRGKTHTAVGLTIVKPNGDTTSESAIRNWSHNLRKGMKLEFYPPFEKYIDVKFEYGLVEGFSLVSLNTFGDSVVVEDFRRRIKEINQSKGLIIDVRNNGGGNSKNAQGIMVHLAERNFIVGPSWKTRIHNAAKKAFGASRHQGYKTDKNVVSNVDYYYNRAYEMNPPDTLYISKSIEKIKVPIVILQSNNTVSAAEDFLIYSMGNENIRRIGQSSKGNSGQPLWFELSNGVTISIVAKRDALPNGQDYIGLGIKPDIEIPVEEDELEFAISELKKR